MISFCVDHPIARHVDKTIGETAKIVGAYLSLSAVAAFLVRDPNSRPEKLELTKAIVMSPVVEQVFHGVLLGGIALAQKGWNHGGALTLEQEKTQQLFRVCISALLLASLHLLDPQKNVASAVAQFAYRFAGFVSYGYLTEKCQTLSVPILAHGIHNALFLRAKTSALDIYDIAIFLLAIR